MACVEAGRSWPSLTNVAGGGVQVEDDFGDLDDTQVAEPGRKTSNEDNVARDMLTRCAEDAAGRATAELKAITSPLSQDAAKRDRRHAERDDANDGNMNWHGERNLRLGGQQNNQL